MRGVFADDLMTIIALDEYPIRITVIAVRAVFRTALFLLEMYQTIAGDYRQNENV